MDTRKTLTMRTWTSGAYSNRMGRHQQGVALTFIASCVLSARKAAYQASQVSQLVSLMTQQQLGSLPATVAIPQVITINSSLRVSLFK